MLLRAPLGGGFCLRFITSRPLHLHHTHSSQWIDPSCASTDLRRLGAAICGLLSNVAQPLKTRRPFQLSDLRPADQRPNEPLPIAVQKVTHARLASRDCVLLSITLRLSFSSARRLDAP